MQSCMMCAYCVPLVDGKIEGTEGKLIAVELSTTEPDAGPLFDFNSSLPKANKVLVLPDESIWIDDGPSMLTRRETDSTRNSDSSSSGQM